MFVCVGAQLGSIANVAEVVFAVDRVRVVLVAFICHVTVFVFVTDAMIWFLSYNSLHSK